MDWTSIFVEDGSEDLIIPRLMDKTRTTSRLSRLVSRVYHHQYDEGLDDAPESPLGGHRLTDLVAHADENSAYSLRAVYYLSINYILGVGCLGIPFAFAKAGFLLCFVILSVITVFSFMTVMWVAETGARFQEQIKENIVPSEESSLLEHPSFQAGVKNRYEVIDLVDFYLGRTQKIIYQMSLMALMYIGLLAYSQVFCGAIAAVLPGGHFLSVLPQIIFGAMVLPLSCMDLEEQLAMQTVMAAIRFVAISVIVFGSLFALIFDGSNSGMEHPPFFATPDENGCKMSYFACFDGFGIAFSTCMFSQLFQHSIPGLLRPLNDYPDKLRKAPPTFAAALLTTSTFYVLLGISAASYFGAATRSSINLNFAGFTFGLGESQLPRVGMVCLHLLSGIVVIFPALDTISVFPLIANTLGNNLYASAGPEFIKSVARITVGCSDRLKNRNLCGKLDKSYNTLPMEERKEALEASYKASSILWRLVAATPPILGSMFATDLSFSFLLAGVAGIHVAFLAPSLLQLRSRRLVSGKTIYAGWYSNDLFCYPVLCFASVSFCIVLAQICDSVIHQ